MSARAIGLLVAAAALLAPAGAVPDPAQAASAPRVDVMVVGKSRVLGAAKRVTARAGTVRAGSRPCRYAAGTALAALAGRDGARGGPSFRVRDFGSCGRRAADAGALFVTRVGPDANRGRDGWVYKAGRRTGTTGAGDTAGPFGTGRLRTGQDVLWFWCRMGASGSCQRTLQISAARTARRGAAVTVRVRGYDDQGRGVVVPGAVVVLGADRARTDARGLARLRAPDRRGGHHIRAARAGLVRPFPKRIAVR